MRRHSDDYTIGRLLIFLALKWITVCNKAFEVGVQVHHGKTFNYRGLHQSPTYNKFQVRILQYYYTIIALQNKHKKIKDKQTEH